MTAATVFMWIFTIILLISVLVMCWANIGAAFGWFESGKRTRVGPTGWYGDGQHTTMSRGVTLGASITTLVSLIVCIIIGATSSKQKEGFKAMLF